MCDDLARRFAGDLGLKFAPDKAAVVATSRELASEARARLVRSFPDIQVYFPSNDWESIIPSSGRGTRNAAPPLSSQGASTRHVLVPTS